MATGDPMCPHCGQYVFGADHICPRFNRWLSLVDTGQREYSATPIGCICPPTSEQTCQNPECPRRSRPTPRGVITDG